MNKIGVVLILIVYIIAIRIGELLHGKNNS